MGTFYDCNGCVISGHDFSPLFKAIERDWVDIVQLMLANGAHVNWQDPVCYFCYII